jgi:tetratricopeptide (TPR) repeat protein
MEQQRYEEALAAYDTSIDLAPFRFLSLDGAARAARALGDTTLARTYYRQLLDIAAPGSKRVAVGEARATLELIVCPPRRSPIEGA